MDASRPASDGGRAEEVLLGLGVASLAAVLVWGALAIPEGRSLVGPRFVPLVASAALLAGGLAIAAAPFLGRPPGPGNGAPQRVLDVVLPSAALALAYLWAWSALGWSLASVICAPPLFAIFGARGWKELVLAPLTVVALLYAVFFGLLGLYHQTGWLLDGPAS